LTPLAEGADRLAARIALECGLKIIVPLPLPKEEYMKDFVNPDSKAEFEELLNQASRSFELPLLSGLTLESVAKLPDDRAKQYCLAGAFLVRYCQILIALWNGVDGTTGGTAQIVEFQKHGIPDPYWKFLLSEGSTARDYLDTIESGPVYHIVTPRREHPQIQGKPFELNIYLPGEESHDKQEEEEQKNSATFDRIYRNIDKFNQNVAFLESNPTLKAMKDRNAGYLFPDSEANQLTPAQRGVRERYAVADTLAQYFQKLTLMSLKRMSFLVFLSVLSFELSAKLAPDNGWYAMTFPALLGVTWIYWLTTMRKGSWQDRHQDYRALAEGMRVEFYWFLINLPSSVADHYLRKQKSELEWIRIAIQNMTEMKVKHVRPANDKERLGQALEHWVQDQARYFARAARRDERELERYEKIIKFLMTASPVIALVTALLGIVHTPISDWMHHDPYAHKILIILVFTLAGVAGVLHNYVDKRALMQHTKQYERMALLFSMAEKRFKRHVDEGDFNEARRILLELGKEALAENGDWVLLHRERPVDVPHAG
jgi:hypothetical protein